jgi:hypothetical protein
MNAECERWEAVYKRAAPSEIVDRAYAALQENEKLTAERDRAYVALDLVSGALCDSGVVVPYDEINYGNAVRELTTERDRAWNEAIAAVVAECRAVGSNGVGRSAEWFGWVFCTRLNKLARPVPAEAQKQCICGPGVEYDGPAIDCSIHGRTAPVSRGEKRCEHLHPRDQCIQCAFAERDSLRAELEKAKSRIAYAIEVLRPVVPAYALDSRGVLERLAAESDLARVRAQNEKLLGALRLAEAHMTGRGGRGCVCGCPVIDGHTDKCRVIVALSDAAEAKEGK